MQSLDPADAGPTPGAVEDTQNGLDGDAQDDDTAYDVGSDGDRDGDRDGDGAAYGMSSEEHGDTAMSERDVPTAPTTGDAVVDEAMIDLAAAEAGTLAERIDAGERAHRLLQGRLSDLGGA